jgi:hypothetical protein
VPLRLWLMYYYAVVVQSTYNSGDGLEMVKHAMALSFARDSSHHPLQSALLGFWQKAHLMRHPIRRCSQLADNGARDDHPTARRRCQGRTVEEESRTPGASLRWSGGDGRWCSQPLFWMHAKQDFTGEVPQFPFFPFFKSLPCLGRRFSYR